MKWFILMAAVAGLGGALAISTTDAAAPLKYQETSEAAWAHFDGTLPAEVAYYGGFPVSLDVNVIVRRTGGQTFGSDFYDSFTIFDPISYMPVLACTSYTPLNGTEFSVDDALASAHLDATVQSFEGQGRTPADNAICPTVPPSHVELDWTPASDVRTTRSRTRGGPCETRVDTQFVDATVSGTTTAGAAGDIPVGNGGGSFQRGTIEARCKF